MQVSSSLDAADTVWSTKMKAGIDWPFTEVYKSFYPGDLYVNLEFSFDLLCYLGKMH